jgi:hypothetical protein
MRFHQLSKTEQREARRLTEQAWAVGLIEATVSQVCQDMPGWRRRIAEAKATAAR